MGVKEVMTNLRKTCKTEEMILLIPSKMGLKNMIRVSRIVRAFFSPENPGAMMFIRSGVKIIKKIKIIIKENKNKLKRLERNSKASFRERTRYSLKTGIIAAEMAPIIKIMDIKSGIRKAA